MTSLLKMYLKHDALTRHENIGRNLVIRLMYFTTTEICFLLKFILFLGLLKKSNVDLKPLIASKNLKKNNRATKLKKILIFFPMLNLLRMY